MITPQIENLKARVVESAEMDKQGRLRPLLLFMGSQTEGRMRSLWNLLLANMDAQVPSVTEAVKLGRAEGFRHLCGLHANPQNFTFNSIIARVIQRRAVADLVPGLWEYARHLGHSSGANVCRLDPIPELTLRVRSDRHWRRTPDELRPQRAKKERVQAPITQALAEFYPYISGTPTDDHELILAVDAIVPRGLPNSMRCDLCQDMLVAVLSGEASVENLRGDLKKHLREFWRMFPDKYGHASLDAPVIRTDKMSWNDKLDARKRFVA